MKQVRDDVIDSVVWHKNMRQPHWLKIPTGDVRRYQVQNNVAAQVRRAQSRITASIAANAVKHAKNIES